MYTKFEGFLRNLYENPRGSDEIFLEGGKWRSLNRHRNNVDRSVSLSVSQHSLGKFFRDGHLSHKTIFIVNIQLCKHWDTRKPNGTNRNDSIV